MLKFEVADLNEIDEPLRTLYEREGDGPFRLKLELPENFAVENVAGLKGALKKERDNCKTLAARVAELEGTGAAETKSLGERVAQLDSQNSKLLAALNEQRIRATCNEAIAAARGVAALLSPVLEKRVAMDGDNIIVRDEKGNTLLNPAGEPLSVQEYVNILRTRDEYGGAFLGTGSSGGGASPASRGGDAPAVTANTRRSTLTLKQKAEFIKEHGTDRYMDLPV